MNEKPQYLTLEQVAEALQLQVETIRRYVRAGELKAARFGRRYRVRPEELDRFVRMKEETDEK